MRVPLGLGNRDLFSALSSNIGKKGKQDSTANAAHSLNNTTLKSLDDHQHRYIVEASRGNTWRNKKRPR